MYEPPKIVMEQPIKYGKRFFLGIILMGLGIFLTVFGIISDVKNSAAIQLEEINADICQEGIYVKGEVTDFVHGGITLGSVAGVSEEAGGGGLSQYTYTIYVADGQMIRVNITGPENKRKMDNVVLEKTPYKLEGKLVKTSVGPNYDWYQWIGDVDTDKIIADYIIVEGEMTRRSYATIGGLGIVVMAAIYLAVYCQMCRKGIVY